MAWMASMARSRCLISGASRPLVGQMRPNRRCSTIGSLVCAALFLTCGTGLLTTNTELPLVSHDPHAELRLPDIETFQFGQLDDLSAPEEPKQENSVSDDQSAGLNAPDDNDELWKLDLSHPKDTSLRTWEAFGDEAHIEPRISYISEAGPRAFDALQSDDTQVLQSAFTLKCLALLGLGRSSALFQWNHDENNFAPTLDKVTLSGLSRTAFDSIVTRLSTIGTAFAQLRQFAHQTYATKSPLAARVALATSVQAVVEALDLHLAEPVLNAPSTLQLLACFDAPALLLAELKELVTCTANQATDANFLSACHDKLEHFANACSPFQTLYTELLNHVSRPWYHAICQKAGLIHGQPDSPEETLAHARHISARDAERISDIMSSISILRETAPDHPLVYPTSWGVEQPDLELSSAESDINRIVAKANQYKQDLLIAISQYDKGTSKPCGTVIPEESDHLTSEQLPWNLDQGQQEYFELVGTQFSQPPAQTADSSTLQTLVTSILKSGAMKDNLDLHLQSPTTTTLQRLQPYLFVQESLLNGSLVRLLFRTHDLRAHLTLNHSFHLLGNGLFIQRLTSALFTSSTSSFVTTSNTATQGLHLDSRSTQKWPPASSELRLGLMGVLSESHGSNNIPGNLSFAIRDLSDAEIERVLDPNGIHALDFLRLRYEAPSPLNVIFNDKAMQIYDDCFRVLLGVLRILHVTTLLRVAAQHTHGSKALQAFSHDAFSAVTNLASYIFDHGIAVPWKDFNAKLDSVEKQLAAEDAQGVMGKQCSLGLKALAELHEHALETIRARLFLRSRHAKVKALVEEVFGIVLAVQKTLADVPDEGEIWQQRRRLKQTVRDLVDALGELGRKVGRKRDLGGQDRDDVFAAEVLGFGLGRA